MITDIVTRAKYGLGLNPPGRNLTVFPDDVFIISYPKSGNTWTRFLIANLLYPQTPADFSNINRLIPDPEALSKRQLARLPRPRFIKSHQYFHPRYPKIIYIVRDPRDVALSQYHFHRKRKLLSDNSSLEEFIARFIAGETSPYGSWGENVASWLVTRYGRPNFLLLRYEDMMRDTVREVNKVVAFLGMQADGKCVAQAVERSSANEMRRLEQQQAHLWSSTRNTRQDVPFVRDAKAGGWVNKLTPTSVERIETAWSTIMKHVGYELASQERRDAVASQETDAVLNEMLR